MPSIISIYVAKHFLYRFLILSIGILSLVYIITFSEMMRKIDTHNNIDFLDILYLSFSQLPPIIDKVFPFFILLSSLWSIFNLLKTSELTILKVSSISMWKIGKIYFATAFLLSLIYVFLIMPMLAYMHHNYRQWESSHIQTVQNIHKKIIIPNTKQIIFLTAQEINIPSNILKEIHLMFIDNNHLIEKIYFSPTAVYDENNKQIIFNQLKALQTDTPQIGSEKTLSNFTLKVNLSNLYALNSEKQSVTSIYDYPNLIKTQKEQKLSADNMYVLFYSLLVLPLTCGIYSFISVSSVPNLSRGLKKIGVILGALSVGLLFYVLDNWIMAISSNGTLPLFIAILTFKIPVILLCIITIFNKEYGFSAKKSG